MRAKDLLLLCANPDVVTELGGKRVQCSGVLAELYVELGGRVIFAGKPKAPIYERALRLAAGLRGAPVPRERVLVIGDSLRTDIAGAVTSGFASLFVWGGIHAVEFGAGNTSRACEPLHRSTAVSYSHDKPACLRSAPRL